MKDNQVDPGFSPRCEYTAAFLLLRLFLGLRTLLAGGDWLPRMLMERLLGQLRRMRQLAESKATLTLREREILSLAGKGLSNAEIAERLCLSPHTIKVHLWRLFRRFGVSNRVQLVRHAHQHGLI